MLTPWKKSYDQPRQHIKKQRHYFANNSASSQSYGFSSRHVWIWELDYKESWALKNWCFELYCWRRLLRISWTARRSKQFILKEVIPEYSLEELMLKLKLQYFGHLMQRWRRIWQTIPVRLPGKSHRQRSLVRLQSMGSHRVGHDLVTLLSCIGEGNGNPLQYSCLENSRDRGAWWAAIYGVTQI